MSCFGKTSAKKVQADEDDDYYDDGDDISGDENLSVDCHEDDDSDSSSDDSSCSDSSDDDSDKGGRRGPVVQTQGPVATFKPNYDQAYRAHAEAKALKKKLSTAVGREVVVRKVLLSGCFKTCDAGKIRLGISPSIADNTFCVHPRVKNYDKSVRVGDISKVQITAVALHAVATSFEFPLAVKVCGLPGKITPLIAGGDDLSGRGNKAHFMCVGNERFASPGKMVYVQKKFSVMNDEMHKLNLDALKSTLTVLQPVVCEGTNGEKKVYNSYAMPETHTMVKILRTNADEWGLDRKQFNENPTTKQVIAPKEIVDYVLTYLQKTISEFRSNDLRTFGVEMSCVTPQMIQALRGTELQSSHYVSLELEVHYMFLNKSGLRGDKQKKSKHSSKGSSRY